MALPMGTTDIQTIFNQLQGLGYLSVFLLMVLEGPIITGIAGFLASLGFFNIWIIIALGVLGNLIPDLILFYIGKSGGNKVLNYLHKKLNLNISKTDRLKERLRSNLNRGIIVVKLTPGLAILGLITIGIVKPKLKDFLLVTFLVNLIATLFFAVGGYYSGFAFLSLAETFNEIVGLVIAAVLILILLPTTFRYIKKRFLTDNK